MLPVPCSVSVCLTFTRIRCHLLVVLDFTHLCSSCPPRRLSASGCSWRPSSGSPWSTPLCSSLLQPFSSSLQCTVNYGLTIYCVVVSVSQGCGSRSAFIFTLKSGSGSRGVNLSTQKTETQGIANTCNFIQSFQR